MDINACVGLCLKVRECVCCVKINFFFASSRVFTRNKNVDENVQEILYAHKYLLRKLCILTCHLCVQASFYLQWLLLPAWKESWVIFKKTPPETVLQEWWGTICTIGGLLLWARKIHRTLEAFFIWTFIFPTTTPSNHQSVPFWPKFFILTLARLAPSAWTYWSTIGVQP